LPEFPDAASQRASDAGQSSNAEQDQDDRKHDDGPERVQSKQHFYLGVSMNRS